MGLSLITQYLQIINGPDNPFQYLYIKRKKKKKKKKLDRVAGLAEHM